MLKIERAKHHINDLNGQINAFLAQRPFKLMGKFDPQRAEATVFVKREQPIPDQFALILGDAVHNLRSALDLLMYGMVSPNAKHTASIYFPFCQKGADPARMDSAITGNQVQLAGKNVVDEIKAIKPYPGGDDVLWGMHSLDITDKHKLILTVGHATPITPDQMRSGVIGDFPMIGSGIFSYESDVLIVKKLFKDDGSLDIRPDLQVLEGETQFQPIFQICFRQGDPFAGHGVITQLRLMTERAIQTVDRLADAFMK